MDKILEKMEAAAEAEYEKILAKWGVFHSAHEGYAVLLEEAEEAQEEMESLREDMKAMWGKIREDAEDEAAGIAEEIYNDAMKCAAELMQVGAVCLRFINSNGKEWGR